MIIFKPGEVVKTKSDLEILRYKGLQFWDFETLFLTLTYNLYKYFRIEKVTRIP